MYENQIYGISVKADDIDYTAFFTLADVKRFLRVDFADDDSIIEMLILAAIQRIENFTGLSIGDKKITVLFKSNFIDSWNTSIRHNQFIELPYPPVKRVAVTDKDGNDIEETDYEVQADQYTQFRGHFPDVVTLTYATGMDALPPALKLAIFNEIYFLYENRGEKNVQLISNAANKLASPFKRMQWI